MAELDANIVTIQEPKFLSVVGKPANRVAWRVVRSAPSEEGPNMTKPTIPSRLLARRSAQQSNVLALQFPEGYTDEQVNDSIKAYGLTGYTVTRSDKTVTALRSDLASVPATGTATIKLTQDGISAVVARQDVQTNPGQNVAAVAYVFRSDSYTAETAAEWAKANGVEGSVEVASDGNFFISRSEVDGVETRLVEIEPGLTVKVARSDSCDIPDGYVASVNECCYGSWGWGQLDFDAAMADEVFSEVMDEAIYTLRRVITNILLQSPLPLAERKSLLSNALNQFNSFASSILDSLPRTLLVAVARSAPSPSTSPQENSMTQKTSGAATQTTAPATTEAATISRAEFDALNASVQSLTEAITALRSAPATTAAPAATTEPAAPATESETITRSALADAVTAAVKPLAEQVATLTAGMTVVRSDTNPDDAGNTAAPKKTGDVWAKRSFLPSRPAQAS